MKHDHFSKLKPRCPVCLAAEHDSELAITQAIAEQPGDLIEGVLQCTRRECQHEYPVIDGIPIIVADLRSYLTANVLPIMRRIDLSACMESIMTDGCGPRSDLDTHNQQVGSYAWGHYHDLDPEEQRPTKKIGTVLGLLSQGLDLLGNVTSGPVVDLGCSVGRTTFALAERFDRLTLGVDLNFSMLRLASNVLRQGVVRYPRRRVGIVYDWREFPVELAGRERIDFWACDAATLPLPADSFSLASALNVIDCVAAPYQLLMAIGHLLNKGGQAILATPYDWSPGATPVETWLGGHSQRGPTAGASEPVLRSLLDGSHESAIAGLELVGELDHLPWHVRLHDRSTMEYLVHLLAVRSTPYTTLPAS